MRLSLQSFFIKQSLGLSYDNQITCWYQKALMLQIYVSNSQYSKYSDVTHLRRFGLPEDSTLS